MAFAVALTAMLGGCTGAASGSRDAERGAAVPAELRIASWNLEHLAEAEGEGCRPRTEADYAELRRHAQALGADVIAFQEVENEAAARRVFPDGEWRVEMEERVDGGGGGCRGLPGKTLHDQRVGFAIRRTVPYTRNPDHVALGLGNRGLRNGVDVTLNTPEPVRLLAVHLKSGCNSGRAPTDRDCDTLFAQVPVLERWVDARAAERVPFAVLGDWNRRLIGRGDAMWAELDDGEPAEADLELAGGTDSRPKCKQRYREFIDFVVLSRTAAARAVPGSFAEYTYGIPEEQHPSDHCPVSVAVRSG